MVTKRAVIGRVLAVFGIALFLAGIGFHIGLLFGFFRAFPYVGAVAMLIGNTIGWFGNSLSAGTLKQEVTEMMNHEASETLRLQTRLSQTTTVLVVIGYTMAVIAAVLVSWLLSQNAA